MAPDQYGEIRMKDQLDILDREDRIFNSFCAAIELMQSSPSQEVREVQVLLDLLLEEWYVCRLDTRSTLS